VSNLPALPEWTKSVDVEKVVADMRQRGYDKLSQTERAKRWSGRLPICPYGCGREGTLLEIVTGPDNRAVGIFNDHPCSCIFVADIQLGEPPTKKKLVIGPDGEYKEVDA
jgi:hypothetical protein